MGDSGEVTTRGSTVDAWTRELAESVGSPGGGAATGLMLAIAASLTSMVAGYTEADPEHGRELSDLLSRARILREVALRLADEDASASSAFGAAFRLEPGQERVKAIHDASVDAARASAAVGEHAVGAIDDLVWLSRYGNRALIADVVVGLGALRATVSGARTNVSFDLAAVKPPGGSLDDVHREQPELWSTIGRLDEALARIDRATAAVDRRAAPTDAPPTAD